MTKQVKQANYSAEAIAVITEKYKNGESLDAIASATGRTVASIRAKLSSLGVYKKVEKATEGKKGGVTKASLVSDIAAIVTGNREGLESLQAATMADLKAILAFLVAEMRQSEGLPPVE